MEESKAVVLKDGEQGELVEGKLEITPAGQVDFEKIMMKAIETNATVETMERLLAMRNQLKAEAAKEAFFEALAAFQEECPTIQKTRVVKGKNGKERYRYAPLESIVHQVKDLLKKNGFSYTIKTRQEDGEQVATCVVHHTFGHEEESEFRVPLDPESYMNAPQRVASSQTYAKRYALCNAFGIMTGENEDDDANSCGPPAQVKTEEQIELEKEIREIIWDDEVFKGMVMYRGEEVDLDIQRDGMERRIKSGKKYRTEALRKTRDNFKDLWQAKKAELDNAQPAEVEDELSEGEELFDINETVERDGNMEVG